MRSKVLILTGALGDGHLQAANAVAETMKTRYPQAGVKTVDFLQMVHPRTHELERFWFVQGVKRFPSRGQNRQAAFRLAGGEPHPALHRPAGRHHGLTVRPPSHAPGLALHGRAALDREKKPLDIRQAKR